MALLLIRLAGFSRREALDTDWPEALAWYEAAAKVEEELVRRQAPG